MFASQNLTVGQLNAVIKKLGGEEGALRLLRGVLVVNFAIWKTIRLGTYKTPREYREALESAGRFVSHFGLEMLESISCSQQTTDIDLVALSMKELDLKGEVYLRDICQRAADIGLDLCPPEVGPALRLAHESQREEWIHVAMEPIVVNKRTASHPDIFTLYRPNARRERWRMGRSALETDWAGRLYDRADYQLVFVRRK